MAQQQYKVGDTVMVKPRGGDRELVEHVVVKVGRKYVSVERVDTKWPSVRRYDMRTGKAEHGFADGYITTQAEEDERIALHEYTRTLAARGIRVEYTSALVLGSAGLLEIIEAYDSAKGDLA